MKTIICALLSVVCSTVTASGHSHHHGYRSSNGTHIERHHHSDRNDVYVPRSIVPDMDTSVVRTDWPYLEAPVIYPYATGTAVLDLARTTWYDRLPTCTAPTPEVLRVVRVTNPGQF